MRLEGRGLGWEGQKEGGQWTAAGKEASCNSMKQEYSEYIDEVGAQCSKNYMKLDYDAESVAVQQQQDPNKKDQEV